MPSGFFFPRDVGAMVKRPGPNNVNATTEVHVWRGIKVHVFHPDEVMPLLRALRQVARELAGGGGDE
jgi:hypothetical protein